MAWADPTSDEREADRQGVEGTKLHAREGTRGIRGPRWPRAPLERDDEMT